MNGDSREQVNPILFLLPPPGKIDQAIFVHPCYRPSTPIKDQDIAKTALQSSSSTKRNPRPAMRSVNFDKVSSWIEQDFMTVEQEVKRKGGTFFTQAQDLALLQGVQEFGKGLWGRIREKHEDLLGAKQTVELNRRWDTLNAHVDEDEELYLRKGPFGMMIGLKSLSTLDVEMETGSLASRNEDECHICEQPGVLICCDSCPLAYHLQCLGAADIPEGHWNCPECVQKCRDIVDDSELKDDDWQQYTEILGEVGSALKKAALNAKNDDETIDPSTVGAPGTILEGTVTSALVRVIQAPDEEFENITNEIEKIQGFKSEPLFRAEDKILRDYVEKEATANEQRSALRVVTDKTDSSPAPQVALDEEDDEDDDDEEEEDDDDDEEEEDDDDDDDDDEEEEEEDEIDDEDDEDENGNQQEPITTIPSTAPVHILQPKRKID